MRILITGGAGCLGSNLVERYLPHAHEILVIDNFATGKRAVVPPMPRLAVVEGSIADRALVDRAFAEFRPSHVIHSAAAYKDPDDWREDAATNVLGTINVVAAAKRAGVVRFLNFQTALCYGRPDRVPIPADHPLRPFTSYGISKTAGEHYVMMSGLPAISLRLANVTGPRLAIGPIPTFYKRLKSGQKCFCTEAVRDFLDMADFLAVVDAAMADGAPAGVFNVSTGVGVGIRQVFDAVAAHLGVVPKEPVPIVPVGADDVAAVVLDPRDTERRLGWTARIDFAETMRRMLQWYDRHGVSDVHSHLKPAADRTR
jgi:nucleoside-diphosphate-sugar epimerase